MLATVPASAAWAHGAHSPTATNYRAQVTGLTPAVPGISVRLIEAGTALELTNHTRTPVEVLGYEGEPYLELRPDGVYENVRSPTTYLNEDYTGVAAVPPEADPDADPVWRRTEQATEAGTVTARWYDHRAHWMGGQPPPGVQDEPGARQRVLQWRVPLRHGDTALEITGTLDWLPPPSPWPWWLGAAIGAGGIALLGLRAHARAARVVLAGITGAGGLVATAYAVAREVDAGAGSPGEVVVWLATGQLWPVLAGLAAVAAGLFVVVGVLRSRPFGEAAPMALAVAGACLAIFAGLADAAVLHRSVAPVPFDALLARLCVAATLAAGAGTAAAGALTLRRTRRPAAPA